MSISKKNFEDPYRAIEQEWLETNGLGGWSGSTVMGAHTRRYHGLLVAAIKPPTDRQVLLSKLDETIVVGDERIDLGVNFYPGTVHPHGYKNLKEFSRDIFPEWYYQAAGIHLKKTVAMIHGENTVVVVYNVIQSEGSFTLELVPLVAGRGYHSLGHEGPQLHWDCAFANGIFHNRPDGNTHLYISVPGAAYRHEPKWFRNFQYKAEQDRGLDYTEDLLNHGVFSISLEKGDQLGIIVSTSDPGSRNAFDLLDTERKRREQLTAGIAKDELTRRLILAADQFIVQRNIKTKTNHQSLTPKEADVEASSIIAGYHWFTDWSRDTMISLPGLCLGTGRFADAKKIIAAFAASVSEGMLPNRFQDTGDEPEYNNVDGTLWYFIAVYKYLQATNDAQFVMKEILPVLKEIIDRHFNGTRYHIKVDADGLLFAGEPGQQLTWMDARVGDWVVTPRMGKPVEVQALWYNALSIFAALLRLNNQEDDAAGIDAAAEKTRTSFNEKFWNKDANCLYDVIDENGNPDQSLRPNQLLAISLPFALIEEEKASSILGLITEKLYTAVGLRTLPKDDARYVPVYEGDPWHRDASYHQGTAWSWLLGPYVDALVKLNADKSVIENVIARFAQHLDEACVGQVSEIFDADPPHHPRGCVAQAWGVGEMLRVIYEHRLYKTKPEQRVESLAIHV